MAWNERAIWHEYTGWFDPARGTTELYGVPSTSIAGALAELAGGAEKIAAKAAEFIQAGKPLEALHLLDFAAAAADSNAFVRDTKRQALELLQQQTGGSNLWERMWINAELQVLPPSNPGQ